MNEAFEKHAYVETGNGVFVPLPNPGKVKGHVNNLKPMKKMLSNIVLERIKKRVED